MKGLVLADTHLGIRLEGFSRFKETIRAMNQISKYAIKNKFDYVIHLGDVFDSNKPSAKELVYFIKWIKRLSDAGIRVRLLTGNHDVYYKSGEGNSILDVIKEIRFPKVRVMDFFTSEVRFDERRTGFLYLPFVTPARCRLEVTNIKSFEDVQDSLEQLIKQKLKLAYLQKIYVLSHLDFEDKKLLTPFREIKLRLPKSLLRSKKVQKIFQGHFHNKSSIKKIKVVGSPLALSFAEANVHKGFYTFRI